MVCTPGSDSPQGLILPLAIESWNGASGAVSFWAAYPILLSMKYSSNSTDFSTEGSTPCASFTPMTGLSTSSLKSQRCRSSTRHLLQLFGVSRSLDCDLRSGIIDVTQIVGCQFDGDCPDVLFQAMQLCGTWNRHNPRFLSQQPSDRDLSRGRLLLLRDRTEQIDQGLIRFPSFRRKARDGVAEVGTIERRVFVDLACEEAFTQRAERNEADFECFECR